MELDDIIQGKNLFLLFLPVSYSTLGCKLHKGTYFNSLVVL